MDRISDLRTPLCKSLSRDVVEHVAASVAEYPDDIPQLIRLLDDTELYNYCIEHMVSPAEKAAVQALCIKTAFRLGKREPELLWELKFYLENAQTQFYSPAFISARKNVLRHIYSLHKK